MNTARQTARSLLRALVLVVLPLGLLTACGENTHYDEDSAGVRRYGAPRPGSIDYGAEGKAIVIGQADNIAKQPAKPKAGPKKPRKPKAGPKRKPRSGKYVVVEVTDGGTITGVVKFSSAPAGGREMIEFNKDQKACGHTEQPSERVVYDKDTLAVANTFVYLSDITKGKGWEGEMAKGEDDRVALLDQVGCTYVPHILAVRTNTQLRIKNSDPAEHNVHMYRGNTSGPTQANVLSPAGSDALPPPAYIEKAGVYEVKCDIHAWMNGYVWASKHPYVAVTGADGRFTLENVPAGTYTLSLWHEGMVETPQMSGGGISGYEYSKPVEQDAKVTVEAGGTASHDFTIEPQAK